jgi:hypothetical protein
MSLYRNASVLEAELRLIRITMTRKVGINLAPRHQIGASKASCLFIAVVKTALNNRIKYLQIDTLSSNEAAEAGETRSIPASTQGQSPVRPS